MITVIRHAFYHNPTGGTLRHTEISPADAKIDNQECCCTKNTCTRPFGAPTHINHMVKEHETIGRFDVELGYSRPWLDVTFRWGKRPYEISRRKDPHATFSFDHNASGGGVLRGCMTMHMDKVGYGRTDCFFGNLYFGNKVDLSKLFNGHSPSRIVKTADLDANALWAHECDKTEAMQVLRPSKETVKWWQTNRDMANLADLSESLVTIGGSVDEIRFKFETNRQAADARTRVKEWLQRVVSSLETTELFRCCDEVARKAAGKIAA